MEAAKLKSLLRYDADTGKLFWLPRGSAGFDHSFAGKEAGCLDPSGYVRLSILGRYHYAHRVVWAWWHGTWPEGLIDHKNQIKNDNRIDNLRLSSRPLNGRNARRSKANKSGVTGVCWCSRTRTWIAQIGGGVHYRHLGYFHDFDAAVTARKAAEKHLNYSELHGRKI